MRKILIFSFLSIMCIIVRGAVLSPDDALGRIDKGQKFIKGKGDECKMLLHTFYSDAGTPASYVFSNKSNKGYVVVSADDCVAPLLGYSDGGSFDKDAIPPQMQWWLAEYGRQIEYASSRGVSYMDSRQIKDGRKVVAPLMSTQWNQDAPYNSEVPSVNGRNYPTGCVATAMAQVMKYWNYPERGNGTGSITLPTGAQGESAISLRISFDWENMLDAYKPGKYDEKQAKAAATLMKACGYSTKMSYSMGGSGTLSRFAAAALVNNFSYNPGIAYCERDYYTAQEWEDMLYEEMAAGRPVLYGGASSSVGHEFVCDGYAGDGYFHFNWGWGGMSDGYFLLAALDPGAVGIGGGTGTDGYNFGQDAVVGIQPTATDSNPPRMTQFGNLSATVSGETVTMSLAYGDRQGYWMNTDFRDITVNFGVTLESMDGAAAIRSVTIKSGKVNAPTTKPVDGGYSISYSGYPGEVTFAIPAQLPDGTYKVTVCSQNADMADAEWLPVLKAADELNYFYLIKSAGKYEISQSVPKALSITEAKILDKLYYGCATHLEVSLSNTSSNDISAGLKPCLYSGDTRAMEADIIDVSLGAGGSATEEKTIVFRILPGVYAPTRITAYKLRFEDVKTGELYDWSGSVRMNSNSAVSFRVNELTARNATLTEEKEGGSDVPNVYEVNAEAEVVLSAVIENRGMYFGYGIAAQVFPMSDPSAVVSTLEFGPTLILGNINETGTVSASLDLSAIAGEGMYGVRLYAMTPNGFAVIKDAPEVYFCVTSSGVSEIGIDEGCSLCYDRAVRCVIAKGDVEGLELYDLEGRKLAAKATKHMTVDAGIKGVVVVVAHFASGETRTLKIIL